MKKVSNLGNIGLDSIRLLFRHRGMSDQHCKTGVTMGRSRVCILSIIPQHRFFLVVEALFAYYK